MRPPNGSESERAVAPASPGSLPCKLIWQTQVIKHTRDLGRTREHPKTTTAA